MTEPKQITSAAGQPSGAAVQHKSLSLSDRVKSLRLQERQAPPPRIPWVSWSLCGLLAVGFVFLGIRDLEREQLQEELESLKRNSSTISENGQTVFAAAAGQADPIPGEIAHTSKGYIVPISLIQVSPLVGARVEKLFIKEGDAVKKGKILALLETKDYEPEVQRAEAALMAAQRRLREINDYREEEAQQLLAELDEAKAQRDQLRMDYQRNLALKNRMAVAPREFEQAHSSFLAMEKRVKRLALAYKLLKGPGPREQKIRALEAEVKQASADLDKAKWKLQNCTVRAPKDGIILTKKAEEGNMLNPSAFSNGLSASLCEMADLTRLEVDLAIPERDIGRIYQYQECLTWAEGFPDRRYKGYVSRIMPQADRGKGGVPVRVRICGIMRSEEGQILRPEMGAIVQFFNRKIDEKEVIQDY
jgi:HlyD family secretion protein